MTKYATQREYQPYIDVVMDALDLTDKVHLEWKFGTWRKMGGDAILYQTKFQNGKRYGVVRVDKTSTHESVLQTIMHELKHIQQYLNNHLSNSYLAPRTKRTGRVVFEWCIKWYNVEYKFHSISNNTKMHEKYRNQPWEVEAYAYQATHNILFPDGKLPTKRKRVGKAGKTTFYKVKG